MATIDEFQRDLTNPALVQTFVTKGTETHVKSGDKDIMVISDSPAALAKQANATDDEYALGRVLKSEGYSGPVEQKARVLVAIGQAVMNKAASLGKTVSELLLHSTVPAADGKFGEQAGRYAATSQDPRPYHIKLAKALLAHALPDVATGGMYFLDPWEPDAEQRGKKLEPFEDVLKRWHEKYHYVRVPMPGVTEDAFMMFKPSTDPVAIANSLADSIVAWKNAFVARGQASAKESEGRIGGPTDPIASDVIVKFGGQDYIQQKADMITFARDHFGVNSLNVDHGKMSGPYLSSLASYWQKEITRLRDAGLAKGLPDSAHVDKWNRDVKSFLDFVPAYQGEAARVGNALVQDAMAETFWKQLDNVVTPINALAGTPTKLQLALQSLKEVLQDTFNGAGKSASSGLKIALIAGGALLGGFVLIKASK